MQDKKVSIVICTYNRLDDLIICLESIRNQSYKNIEIIVIDDNSSEDIKGSLKTAFPQVRVLRNRVKRYPSFAKNQGALLSNGEYLLFLDSDTELLLKDSILNQVRILDEESSIGAVGGEIKLEDNGKISAVTGVRFEFKRFYVLDVRDPVDERTKRKTVDVIDASNMLVRRSDFFAVGGFDPNFLYPHEDSDLCLRLRKRGLSIVVDFNTGVLHKRSSSMRMNQKRFFGRARIYYQIKNFGILRTQFIDCYHSPSLICLLEPLVWQWNKIAAKSGSKYALPGDSMSCATVKEATPGRRGPVSLFFKTVTFFIEYLRYIGWFFYNLFYAIFWNIFNIRKAVFSRGRDFLKDKDLIGSIREEA